MSRIRKKDVVNLTGGIETDDGRTLYGMDAEQYLKEDPAFERKVGEWIEDVLGESINTSNLYESLRSGVVLIRLVNTIKPDIVKKYNTKSKLHPLMERENINLYLEACWKLGVESSEMFITSDLHSKKGMSSVLNNVVALSREAPRWGNVSVSPIGPPVRKKRSGPYKYEVNVSQGGQFVGELESDSEDAEEQVKKLRMELLIRADYDKLQDSHNQLEDDLKSTRERLRQGNTSSSNNGSSREVGDLKRQLLDQKKEVTNIKRDLVAEKKKNIDLMKEASVLRREVRSARNSNVATTTNDDRVIMLTEEVKALNSENETLINDYKTLQQENMDLVKQIGTLQDNTQVLMQLRKENQDLRKQLTRKNNTIHNSQRSVNRQAEKQVTVVNFNSRLEDESEAGSYFGLLKRLQKHIANAFDADRLMNNTDQDINDLKDIFNKDSGRRVFAHELENYVSGKPTLVQSDSFNFLLFMVNSALSNMSLHNGADFISGKRLLEASIKIYRKEGKEKETLIKFLRAHPVWQNLEFWREASEKFSSTGGEERYAATLSKKQVAFFKKLIKTFAVDMYKLGNIQTDEIISMCEDLIDNIDDMPDNQRQNLKDKLAPALSKTISELA